MMKKNALTKYSKTQLSLYNGQDKNEIWCSFRGLIYDLTNSGMWFNGRHYEHWAGQDLTDELKDAPHDDKVFEKFKIVGILI